MSDSAAYDLVIPQKLKLSKSSSSSVSVRGVSKRRRKKHKKNREEDSEVPKDSIPTKHDEHREASPKEPVMTKAELAYAAARKIVDERDIEVNAQKSHREKVMEFNDKLANMSEHYDIPKVGPG